MKPSRPRLIGLLLTACCAGAILIAAAPSTQTYSVAQIKEGLRTHPRDWIGRTVLVHGLAYATNVECAASTPVSVCVPGWHIILLPTSSGGWSAVPPQQADYPDDALVALNDPSRRLIMAATPRPPLPLHSPAAVLAPLARLPLIGALLPSWGGESVYRVRLLASRRCDAEIMDAPCGAEAAFVTNTQPAYRPG